LTTAHRPTLPEPVIDQRNRPPRPHPRHQRTPRRTPRTKQHYETQLANLQAHILHTPNADLIDTLPITEIQIDQLPEALARSLFEALRLEIHYNKHTNTATCRITLTGQTITTARHAAHHVTAIPLHRKQGRDQHKH
jgi:site-specific DNA recombinase